MTLAGLPGVSDYFLDATSAAAFVADAAGCGPGYDRGVPSPGAKVHLILASPRRLRPAGGVSAEKTMEVTGGCHCGQITYEAEVDPATVRVCHCTDCQRLTGTAFRTNISSVPGTFVLKSGTPKIYIKTAESGNKRAHAFCPECGTPIYAAAPEPNPSTVGLRVGGIDQRAQFEPPTRQAWCRSALPWSMDLTGVERAERQ